MENAAIFALGVFLGAGAAYSFTEKKWRDNADDYMRIESKGHLYKVHRAD